MSAIGFVSEMNEIFRFIEPKRKLKETVLNTNGFYPVDVYSKLSWNVGTEILAEHNGKMKECVIRSLSSTTDLDATISVEFIDTGSVKTFKRNEPTIQSHPRYIKNRQNLTRFCMIDRLSVDEKRSNAYSAILREALKWIPDYIDNYDEFTTNSHKFSVRGQSFPRWSPKIRCCSQLSQLRKHCMIFVFDAATSNWCVGKIIDFMPFYPPNAHQKLNVFKVHYHKKSRVYCKYVHQFSASIGLISDALRTECSSIEKQIGVSRVIDMDANYVKCHNLLLRGYIRRELGDIQDAYRIFVKYIGCLYVYHLVMEIESRTWSTALRNRNKYDLVIPKAPSLIHKPLNVTTKKHLESIDEKSSLIIAAVPAVHSTDITAKSKSTLNPNAPSFVFKAQSQNKGKKSRHHLNQMKNNPYCSKPVQKAQRRVWIPWDLRELISSSTCVKENICDILYYMVVIHSLHFMCVKTKTVDNIKIFDYNLHHKDLHHALYGIATRQHLQHYEWCLMPRLYSAQEIAQQWRPSLCILPKIATSLSINKDADKIKAALSDKYKLRQIVYNTNWCRIKIFNRLNHKERMEYKVTKEEFKAKCIRSIDKDNDIHLVPILMVDDNKTYSVQFLYIVRVAKRGNVAFDIGISFKFNGARNVVKASGIHIDRDYIINQHQLVHPQCACLWKDTFVSIIDQLSIGNPDDTLNKLRAAQKRIEQLSTEIKLAR